MTSQVELLLERAAECLEVAKTSPRPMGRFATAIRLIILARDLGPDETVPASTTMRLSQGLINLYPLFGGLADDGASHERISFGTTMVSGLINYFVQSPVEAGVSLDISTDVSDYCALFANEVETLELRRAVDARGGALLREIHLRKAVVISDQVFSISN